MPVTAPNLAKTFGVLGPGDRMGTTVDPGGEFEGMLNGWGIVNGCGRIFGDGADDGVFLRVSVTAAKLSALDNDPGWPPGEPSDDAIDRPLAESEDGDLDFDRLGLGAGTGGLLAIGPAGRSMTRSGVWPGVVLRAIDFCSQKDRLPRKLADLSPESSDEFPGLPVDLFSHMSLFLANKEIFSIGSWS